LPKLRLSHIFQRATRGKNSNYFPTKVMPQFWQYACYKQWLPSHDTFQQGYFLGQVHAADLERGSTRSKRMALTIGLLCGLQYDVCALTFCGETRYCRHSKATLDACHYFFCCIFQLKQKKTANCGTVFFNDQVLFV